jgi:hypothetical protein
MSTPTLPKIGTPRSHAPMNGPDSLAGASTVTFTLEDGTIFTVADWEVATGAPDADGVMHAQLSGWLTESLPYNADEPVEADGYPVPVRVIHGRLAGHEALDGKEIRYREWTVGVPMLDGKKLWDHPGMWITVRWIHKVLTDDTATTETAAAPGTTFADVIAKHKDIVATIIGDGEPTDLGELTPASFTDHVETVQIRLSMSPSWDSERVAAEDAHTFLTEALAHDESDPARPILLEKASGRLAELGDESDYLC